MQKPVRSRTGFGRSVIIAIGLSIAAVAQASDYSVVDLNYFHVDCRIKQQQIEFLQSLRPTPAERGNSGLLNMLMPWKVITDSNTYENRAHHASGRTDWMINQLLMELRTCP